MCSRFAGRLLTSPIAFLVAGILDFLVWGMTELAHRLDPRSTVRRR